MTRTRVSAGLASLAILLSAGCDTVGTFAPPVSPAMTRASPGSSPSTLEAGRHTLATRCTGCHGLNPIAKYPTAEWRVIVAKMAPRAKLDPAQESALLAYLTAARESAPAR